MIKQYKCLKFDKKKIKENDIVNIIMSQYDIPKEELPISASNLYMPESEQEVMKEYMMKNAKEFKSMPKKMLERKINYLVLDVFPSSIEK